MTIDQVIALAASVGACLAAVATFLTVLEMVKQRASSYRPELIIAKVTFDATANADRDKDVPRNWRRTLAKNNWAPSSHYPWERFALPLVNIGLGAAKAV